MPNYIDIDELKYNLKQSGIKIKPKYCHEDYRLNSYSCPYPLANKLTRISNRYEISKSKIIQLFLEKIDEYNLYDWLRKD